MYRHDGEAARLRMAALEEEIAELRRAHASRGTPARAGAFATIALTVGVVLALAGTVALASAGTRSAPSPSRRARAAAIDPAPAIAPAPMSEAPPAAIAAAPIDESPPLVDPRSATIAAALEPAHPDVIEVLDAREQGDDLFVLHRFRGALAWEHAQREAGTLEQSLADYEDRLAVCEDGTDDDDESARCALEEAPDRWIGLRDSTCEDVHAIEVAHLARVGGATIVRARAQLLGPSCVSTSPSHEPEIRASDVDGDGHLELTVIAPFVVPTTRFDQDERGTIGAILDARDLHAQLFVLRDYDASYGDVDAITRAIATTWDLEDRDGDGSIDARVRQRSADVDDFDRSTAARSAECPYDRAADRWECAEDWLIDPRLAAIDGSDLDAVELAGDASRHASRRRAR